MRAGLPFTPCGRLQRPDCVLVRGQRLGLGVWVDETPLIGGMEALFAYGLEEVHSIVVSLGCWMVRVYTKRFMERLASGRNPVFPSLPECSV